MTDNRKKISKTTFTLTHKNGCTEMYNDKVKWTFGYEMCDETIIASLVFQTIFMKFRQLTTFSEDFSIEFTMEETVNEPDEQ